MKYKTVSIIQNKVVAELPGYEVSDPANRKRPKCALLIADEDWDSLTLQLYKIFLSLTCPCLVKKILLIYYLFSIFIFLKINVLSLLFMIGFSRGSFFACILWIYTLLLLPYYYYLIITLSFFFYFYILLNFEVLHLLLLLLQSLMYIFLFNVD